MIEARSRPRVKPYRKKQSPVSNTSSPAHFLGDPLGSVKKATNVGDTVDALPRLPFLKPRYFSILLTLRSESMVRRAIEMTKINRNAGCNYSAKSTIDFLDK